MSPSNRVAIISDLHLGPGRDENGTWNDLEDFRFENSFRQFLEFIGQEGSTDLIIAGDFIDFWPIRPDLDENRPPHWGSLEEESLIKLEVTLKAHKTTFSALRKFANRSGNRLIIIPGNHDVDLHWPGVQDRLQQELGLELGERLFFARACYRSQGLHVEHGHQYDEANRFRNPIAPFVTINDEKRLETNWGTVFVSRWFNSIERERPFVDNLYPLLSTVAWAVRNESPHRFSLPRAGELVVMLFKDQRALDNLGFLVRTLGPTELPTEIPEQNVENLLRLYQGADPELTKSFRILLESEQRLKESQEALEELSGEIWRRSQSGLIKKPKQLREALGIDSYEEAARKIVVKSPEIRVVVMGHTHEIDRQEVTLLRDVGSDQKWYVNTGCWQKAISVKQAQSLRTWRELDLDDDSLFPLRFSYVIVDYDDFGNPKKPSRFFWIK